MPKFTPVPWEPEPAPELSGDLAPNTTLKDGSFWTVGGEGPEDVVVGQSGTAYSGTADGMIHAVTASGSPKELAEVGGRPLGIEWYGDDLLVCNADLGLQLVSMSGSVEVLSNSFNGEPFMLTNNATVASDGTIYFTVSSSRWALTDYVTDLIEGQSTGRLLARAPDGSISVVADGLQFANGVALDPSEESVFVAEMGRYRIHRISAADGSSEVFIDNLPGFPDNLSVGHDTLWVAVASPRQAIVDFMAPRNWMRRLSNSMPEAIKPKAVRHGMVLGYAMVGTLRYNLQDETGTVGITTSARFHDGRLFVGNLHDHEIAVVEI